MNWIKVLEPGELPEGEVKTVVVGRQRIAMTHVRGTFGALDDRCPHQGASLGEGTIQNGLVRCPLHAWCFNALTGKMPGAPSIGPACFPVEVREDGIFIGLES